MAATGPCARVLIANRGEIARRIIRACNDLGVVGIAIYTEADKDMPFVAEAGAAVSLGGDPGGYMDVEKVIAAAKAAQADSIHPGYGFLSERADFAQRVNDEGMVFIGPTPDSIERMGSKIAAKALLKDVVPLVPGRSSGTHAEWLTFAAQIGYPVLVKASAGGGGRGMHVAEDEAQLKGILAKAEAEAKRLFGEAQVMLEKYLPAVKHIEVQIFGDAHGRVIHLLDRECSLQRRHQKVIEEAPSPSISDALRRDITAAAVRVGETLSYRGAGTVEFVVDCATQKWYFLEVNTRLQVEHPVTELVTNVDLPRLQIYVARGGKIADGVAACRLRGDRPVYPVDEAYPTPQGHAIEARVYAEDFNLQPTVGTVEVWDPSPPAGAGHGGQWSVDFHDAVCTNCTITTNYDNMISKVVAWEAAGRARAADRLRATLEGVTCFGLPTNKLFLIAVLRHPEYLRDSPGDQTITTKWIERTLPALQADALGSTLAAGRVVHSAVACSVLASLPVFMEDEAVLAAAPHRHIAAASTEPSHLHLRHVPRAWCNTGGPRAGRHGASFRSTTRVFQLQAATHGILPELTHPPGTPSPPSTEDVLVQVKYTRDRAGAFECGVAGPRGANAKSDYLSTPLVHRPVRVEVCEVGGRDTHGGYHASLLVDGVRAAYYVRRGRGVLPGAEELDEPGHPSAIGQPTDMYHIRRLGVDGGAELSFLKVPLLCFDERSGAVNGIPATLPPTHRDYTFASAVPAAMAEPAAAEAADGKAAPTGTPVRSPMMAKIFKTAKKTGDAVKENDVVVVLESMKMETEIRAPHAGTVAVRVKKDDLTRTGAVLFYVAK